MKKNDGIEIEDVQEITPKKANDREADLSRIMKEPANKIILSKTKKTSFSTTELDDRMSFRVNSNILKEFTKIAEEQGFNPSLVLRKYMESVVKNSDKQQKLF